MGLKRGAMKIPKLTLTLPPITPAPSPENLPYSNTSPSKYQTIYKRDFKHTEVTLPRIPSTQPSSPNRKHRPQPTRVFLLHGQDKKKHVCGVCDPPKPVRVSRQPTPIATTSIPLVHSTLKSQSQKSYTSHDGHLNYRVKPTRYAANKTKYHPARGIIPMNKERKGEFIKKKKGPCAAYVLNQHLPQDLAVEDMEERADTSDEIYQNQALPRRSRKKWLSDFGSCFTGSSPLVVENRIRQDKNSCDNCTRRRYYLHSLFSEQQPYWEGSLRLIR